MNPLRRSSRPLTAAVLSAAMPGLGQLANGDINKASWLFLCFAALSVPAVAVIALYLPAAWTMPTLLLGLALTLGTWVYGIRDAWRTARAMEAMGAPPWRSSGVCALAFAAGNLLTLPFLIGYVRAHQVESLRVPSSSMAPTVQPGDYFFADKRYNCPGCGNAVRRGDIAIFVYPNDRSLLYVKRIVALPGDRVQISGGDLRLNGKSITLPKPAGQAFANESIEGRQWQVDWSGPPSAEIDITVPPGEVFALGDNRSASVDSRRFGTVPLHDVVGKARQVWFSHGSEGIRWIRLGRVLQ